MHERTQRAVARLLFVFCCALPTATVFAILLISWTPWYQARKLAELKYQLGRETGLSFQIDRYERIAPGKYVLENVRVSDPDSRRHVATIRMIDYFHGEDHVAVILHQPEFQSAGLGDTWKMLHDRLIRRPAHTVLPISIAATDVNLRSRAGSLPPTDISATITPEGESVRMTARAEDATGHHGIRIRFDLFRDRDRPTPATEWVLSTEGTALPCSALADYAPAIRSLGREALFSGMIKCKEEPGGWSYDLGGSTLTNMNLDDLTAELPRRVVGKMELRLVRCEVRPGETVNLVGTLSTPEATSLRLKAPLLVEMRDHLGLLIDERELLADVNGIECKLGIHFDIRDQTMQLSGIGGDALLYARGRSIAWAGTPRIEADEITAMLAPPSRWLTAWNRVFLPSVPSSPATTRPSAEIRNVGSLRGKPSIQQR